MMLDADEREEVEAKDYRRQEAEEAEQKSRVLGLGSSAAAADFKAVLLKHFGIRDEQAWMRVTIDLDYRKNVLAVNQELDLVAPAIVDVKRFADEVHSKGDVS